LCAKQGVSLAGESPAAFSQGDASSLFLLRREARIAFVEAFQARSNSTLAFVLDMAGRRTVASPQ